MPDQATTGAGRLSPFRVTVVVVLVAAAVLAWALTRTGGSTYRTAVVGTGTVEATLDTVGSVTPVNQAGLNFSASGTVSAVNVVVGQKVTAGQTLASLDLTSLNATVTSVHATLTAAQAVLANAEASEDSSGSTASTTTTTGTSSGSGSSAETSQQIAKLQATLTSDQAQVDSDSTQAGADLAAATALCVTSVPASTASASASASSSSAVTGEPTASTPGGGSGAPGSGTTSGAGTSGSTSPTTCSAALAQATSAQATAASDIKAVTQDESTLNAVLGSASSGTSASTPSTGSTGTTSKPASPQQLAVDQASIDTAQADLTEAKQALGGANLVSTIDGTVAAVSITDGQSVTAGGSSSSPQVVVIGTGSRYEVSTDIAVADIAKVAVGETAKVTPDSTTTAESGQVSSIGVLATSGTSSTTYPVTIALDSSDLGQLSGADANVSIVVQKSTDVTTVPSSAVSTVGSAHVVTLVDNNVPKTVRVTIGTVGDILTQVKSGVSRGEVVSLADLNQPLPSSSTSTLRSGFGAGGLGGASLGGASFGGGSFGGRAGGLGG